MNIYYAIPSGSQTNIEEQDIALRLIQSLSAMPYHTGCFTIDTPQPFETVKNTPSLIHAFHAAKTGLQCQKLSEINRLPLVITCTGLDVYIDMFNTGLHGQLQEVLESARKIIVPFDHIGKFIKLRLQIKNEIETIAPGIAPLAGNLEFSREHFGLASDERLILLESGILPSKNTLFAINQLSRIIKDYPSLRLVIISTPSDIAYHEKVLAVASDHNWVRIIGRPAPEELVSLYKHAEVFVNVSHAEGYNPCLLQAMQVGLPVLAADIYGNHALIRNEALFNDTGNGWLYFTSPAPVSFEKIHDSEDFIEKLRFILDNPEKAREVGKRAAATIQKSFSIEKEVYLHMQLYKNILK